MTPGVWLVTGASSGLGAAFARRALGSGHRLVVTARRREPLEALARSAPGRVVAHFGDLAVPGEAARAVHAAIAAFGRIDVLVNNAGVGMLGAVEETSDAELRALFDLNFHAAVEAIRTALPGMRARGSGAIVNISSFLGRLSIAGLSAYSATKFALEGMSEALAAEVAAFGVRVLIVEPGGFRTGFNSGAFRQTARLDAYDAQLGGLRSRIEELGRQAVGDPALAAAALERLLEEPVLPLRVQFGSDSVAAIRGHSQSLLTDLERWEPFATTTDFPVADARPA